MALSHSTIRIGLALALLPLDVMASQSGKDWFDMTSHVAGITACVVFVVAYMLVMTEEFTQLRKSKPVILAAGVIWAMIAFEYHARGFGHIPEAAFRDTLVEFAELFLFLLAAMTYVNTLQERQVFEALRSWLLSHRFGYRKLFWITGLLAFCLSPLIDNLTTALVMCAVVMAVGRQENRFVVLSCVNIVVAANAGGAFSPFGDITTLMVWQQEKVGFLSFFHLLLPSAVNFIVPASIMHFFLPKGQPVQEEAQIQMLRGAVPVMFLFALTIATAVGFHQFLGMPPMLGMMTGLGYLQIYGYFLKRSDRIAGRSETTNGAIGDVYPSGSKRNFDIYSTIARAEWDTLLFFYGVVLCVGGLGFIGYLSLLSESMYGALGFTWANIWIGVLSAIVDNIPVMFAVLTMDPNMSLGQWLLVTLTAGAGGSLLSIGSAAGVALMGQARGSYTFFAHLKWTPVIALGYALSILVHIWLNADLFGI